MTRITRLFTMLCMAAATLFAQEARLTGTVTDPSGSILPAVAISATQTERNLTFSAVTNTEGRYLFPRLPIGNYR
ncbi:MAG: carboxypeptidase-like regulatory domain-containing protein, partial [Bryobacteraceae bacterium]